MDKTTELIVYAIKNYKGSSDKRISQAMAEITGTPDWSCGRSIIDKILRQCCAEVIEQADNPIHEVRRYFMNDICIHNDYDRMIAFLGEIRIRGEDGKFINGFGADYWSNR